MRLASAVLALALFGAAPLIPSTLAAEPAATESFAQGSLKAGRIQASLARLAVRRADSDEVRRFAGALLGELDARNGRLADIVRAEGFSETTATVGALPPSEIPERRREFNRLRAREGSAFDKQFLRAIIVGYENALRGYEAQASIRHEDLRTLVAESAPQMKERLAEARRLLEQIEREQR